MAIMDVSGPEYWHIEISGRPFSKQAKKALAIFPSPTITYKGGIIRKNIRAYHEGGSVNIEGIRNNGRCVECKFPDKEKVPGLVSYLPVTELGFDFVGYFHQESTMDRAIKSYQRTLQGTNFSLQRVIFTPTAVIQGEKYIRERPSKFTIEGQVKTDHPIRVIELYNFLKRQLADEDRIFLGELKFSTLSSRHQTELEEPRLF